MDHPLPRKRRTFFSDYLYDVLCEDDNDGHARSYIDTFRSIKYPPLADYPIEEKRMLCVSALATTHTFDISAKGGFSKIELLTKDPTLIDRITLIRDGSTILDLNGPVLKLVYGPSAIMSLSDMMSCYHDQPIITDVAKLTLEVRIKQNQYAGIDLVLSRTPSTKLYLVKTDKYPYYNCKNQQEINMLLVRKLNELTTMINSGNFTQTELIETVDKYLVTDFDTKRKSHYDGRRKQIEIIRERERGNEEEILDDESTSHIRYYDKKKNNCHLCIEYGFWELITDRRPDDYVDYVDISKNPGYDIGFYVYMDDMSNVFKSIKSIWIRINQSAGMEFKFLEEDCLQYGSFTFISLVKGFDNQRKPWLIKDWIEVFEKSKIPNFRKSQLEVKVEFNKDSNNNTTTNTSTDRKMYIIPIRLNARMYRDNCLVRMIY